MSQLLINSLWNHTIHVGPPRLNSIIGPLQLHKMWIFTILKPYFHHKNLRDGYLWLWCEASSKVKKWICLSKLSSHFSFKTLSSPVLNLDVARCHNGWNLNTSTALFSLRNARETGLETSSGHLSFLPLLLKPFKKSSNWQRNFQTNYENQIGLRCLNWIHWKL